MQPKILITPQARAGVFPAVLQPRVNVARTVMFGAAAAERAELDPREVNLARKNSLGLEFAAYYPGAVSDYREEQFRYEQYQHVLLQTSSLLEHHQIPHLYIKFRKLYGYYDSNVDVVVPGVDWRRTIEILQGEGYSGHVMFKEPDKIMFSKPGQLISIHLHPGVTWNGVPYFSEVELWQHSRPAADCAAYELSPEYDFMVNLAHDVFENYEFSLGDTLYFSRCMEMQPLDPGPLKAIASSNGWGHAFDEVYLHLRELLKGWEDARRTREIPAKLLGYPYAIPLPMLARAFWERIRYHLQRREIKRALREVYAYPAFYALKRRHDLPFLSRG